MAEVNAPRQMPSETTAEIMASTSNLTPIYATAIRVLSLGFRIGAAILAIGLVVALIRSDDIDRTAVSYGDLPSAILDGEAGGIISLAIIVLVATPVVTVITIARGFFQRGDRRYGTLSLGVLCVLAISISLSLFR